MKVLHAHPSAGIFIRQTTSAYYENDMLEKFYTTFIAHKEYFLSNLIKTFIPYLEKELERKAIHEIPFEKIQPYPYKELLRLFASRYTSPIITDRVFEWAEYSFDKWVARNLDPMKINAVHSYEHAALQTLMTAKQKGIFTIYEQPSQHHSFFAPIVNAQLQQYPELSSSETDLLINKKSVYRNKRRDKELLLADLILCNSSFTKRTLVDAGINEEKIKVVPHGFPQPLTTTNTKKIEDRPIIFLNAGTQNLRKGIHLLYNAWRRANFSAKEAQLWLIGRNTLPKELLNGLGENVMIKDSIPREELMQLYKEADIFVLPTLADGFAMVLSEAMSQGVPVITTENSMAPDFVKHNENGWVVPVGDEDALLYQMKWCVENKHLIPTTSNKALETAKKWQWEDYRKKTAETVQNQFLLYNEAKNRK